MLFATLNSSPVLDLQRYADIDHFRESERYARAESVPLKAGNFSVLRASLDLPSCSLSLVRSFPRIVRGYDLQGRLLVVIPMNDIATARINGEPIGQSVLLLKGAASCTVHEPEGRLIAIVTIRPTAEGGAPFELDDGYRLIALPPATLERLQSVINGMLKAAAKEPDAIRSEGIRAGFEHVLFASIAHAIGLGAAHDLKRHEGLFRYKALVDRVDDLIEQNPAQDLSCPRMAEELGVSVRTLQNATRMLCGAGAHEYGRLRRLWSVRRQLRAGAPGLTVKASALANGFWHMGEFSRAYRDAFGELPSLTLTRARG